VRLYRVFPHDPSAAPNDPGGAFFRAAGGPGRIDNPDLYRVLYAACEAECAIAEVFGDFAPWRDEMLAHHRGVRYALATIDLPDTPPIWDMNNAKHLALLRLKPTDVIRRNLVKTQVWAARVWTTKQYRGISWWSYYNPDWTSYGLWDIKGAVITDVLPLTLETPALRAAAAAIIRPISPR
jgi:hypothetical protein